MVTSKIIISIQNNDQNQKGEKIFKKKTNDKQKKIMGQRIIKNRNLKEIRKKREYMPPR